MDQKALIQYLIAWTLTLVFVFTAFITALSLVGWLNFQNEDQQEKLFYVLIVEVVVVGIGYFKGFINYPIPRFRKTPSPPATTEKERSPAFVKPAALHEIMQEAKKSLVISGHTLDKFSRREANEVRRSLQSLFEKGVKVTLVLLHPECAYQDAHERFHRLETTSPTKSAKDQIEATIVYFQKMEDFVPSSFSVYLSDYMPRFRTIIIDNRACYISLYMYAEDVDITPQHKYQENSPEFQAVVESLVKQLRSPHVVPLIKDGKFNRDWRNRGILHTLDCCFQKSYCPSLCPRWQTVRSVFLGNQNPSGAEIPGVCDSTYRAGTFTLAEMELSEKYLKKKITFDEWLQKAVEDEWDVLLGSDEIRSSMDRSNVQEQVHFVRKALDFQPPGYDPLKQDIWFEEYSDIVRRIMLTSLLGNPDLDVKQQVNLTQGAKMLVIKTIDKLRLQQRTARDWLKLSVIAGAVGINTKPDHAATSVIIREASIPLEDETHMDQGVDQKADSLARKLHDIVSYPTGVDDTEQFFQKIKDLASSSNTVRLVSFPDDYIETLFLLEFYDQLLEHFSSVHICMIPRSVRCGNDATASDVFELLENFPKLKEKSQSESPRFAVLETGPKIGGVNLRKLHPEAAEAVRQAHILDVRGARNYEMMQRVLKDAFFGFMVARTTSEVVTGLNARERPFFYKFQEKGSCSFVTEG